MISLRPAHRNWGKYVRHLLLLALILSPQMARGGELHFLAGGMREINSDNASYAFMGEYREGGGENIAVSTLYLNEGHVPNHHRDGFAPVMVWGRTNLLDRQLSLALGAGPYLYADTTVSGSGQTKNDHNVGGIAGLSAIWYCESRLLLQARLNLVQTGNSFNTATALVGVGYQLDTPKRPGPLPRPPRQREKTTDQELTLFLGQTVVNNPGSKQSMALDMEYRYGIAPYLDLTGSWLHEYGTRVVRRNGVMTQLWLVRDFLDDHLCLGIGAGPYLAVDRRSGPDIVDRNLSAFATPMLSFTASIRNFDFNPNLSARLSLNRLVTNYDKDSDTFLLGVGYRF